MSLPQLLVLPGPLSHELGLKSDRRNWFGTICSVCVVYPRNPGSARFPLRRLVETRTRADIGVLLRFSRGVLMYKVEARHAKSQTCFKGRNVSASDTALWERWKHQRDPDAFGEIVSRHSGMVYATCKRILKNAADAEDAAQECFLELLNRRVIVRTSLAPWLHTVAVRRAFNRAKSETRRRRRERQFVADGSQSTEVVLDDLLDHVDAAIAGLPEKLRDPVVCRFLEGQSYEEIARGSRVAESTIRYRTDKGIERIRAFLKRRGVPIGAAGLAGVLAEHVAEAAPATLETMLRKLAIAGTTASIVAKSGGVSALGVLLNMVRGLLMMKKLLAGAVITAAVLAALWAMTRTPEKGTLLEQEQYARTAMPQEESLPVDSKSASHSESLSSAISASPEAAPPAAPAPVPSQNDGIRIAGRVVDQASQPVAGAHVVARAKEFEQQETQSSSDGAFELFVDMISNDVTLQAEKESSQSEVFGPSKLREPGVDGIVLRLDVPRTGSIAGVVVDRSGSPIPNLFVNAHRTTGVFARQVEAVLTDSNGAFKLAGLAAGQYGLVASFYRGNPEILMKVEISEGQALTGLRAVFDLGDLTIAGRVVDTSGKPIEGADVFVHNGFGGDTSDADGGFLIKGLTSVPQLMIDAAHERYSWAHVPNVRAGTQDLQIVMHRKTGVEGRVLRADDGAPVPEFDVFHAQQPEATGPFDNRRHVRDPEGHFALADLSAETTTVTVRAAGYAPSSQDVSLEENQTVSGLEFRLVAGRFLEGRVETASGAPVASACIYSGARAGWPERDAYIAQSDLAGRFQVTSLSAETQQISACHPDYAPSSVNVESASEARIVLQQAGSIEGTVVRGGQPVPGMPMMAVFPNGQSTPSVTRTDGAGAYKLEGLAPETAMVYANAARIRDGGALVKTVTVEPGSAIRVDFEFGAKSAQVSGRVTMAGETPLEAKVGLFNAGGVGYQSATHTTPDGWYEFESVPAGEVVVSVEATTPDGRSLVRGITLRIAEEEAVRQDIDFAASERGEMTGSVLGVRENAMPPFIYVFSDGTPLPEGADVTVLIQRTAYAYSAAQCAADGTFTVAGLAPGHYTVLAVEVPITGGPSEARYAITETTIGGDKPVTVNFVFDSE